MSEGSGSIEEVPKRSGSSNSNRCSALSPVPAPGFHPFYLVLHISARQRGQLGVVEEKGVPFLFLSRVIDLDQGEVRIKDRWRRTEELRRGQGPVHLCLPM